MVQQVKPAHNTGSSAGVLAMLVRALATLLTIKLSVNVPQKVTGDSSSIWFLPPVWETQKLSFGL